jgi:cellulose synthase/poly-beta-1,6-N-acetylglucosamine synthase-like glycosyltransferase/exo-beta-1,3-glucanase (GH17 family)
MPAPKTAPKTIATIASALAVAALLHAAAWIQTYRTVAPPDAGHVIESLSFNIDIRKKNPSLREQQRRIDEIEERIERIADVTRSLRTYSVLAELAHVPEIAARHDLAVSLGAWIGKDETRNRREIDGAVELASRHRNVRSIVVGNETILRQERTVEELIGHLREVRRRTNVPVTTGETWEIWIAHPELVKEVDFIAAHILPYWEAKSAAIALRYAFGRYEDLKRAYPGKRIVIAEFGWPSRGYNRNEAAPRLQSQAEIIRGFIAEAHQRGIFYNIIEAYDQPWKTAEGSVGPYWGLFTDQGHPKFKMVGRVAPKEHRILAVAALLIGAGLAVFGLWRRKPTFGHALAYALAAQAMGAGIALAAAYPFTHYLHFGAWVMWIMGFGLMIPLVVITLAKVHEMAEVMLGRGPQRLIPREGLPARGEAPMVSIHIPAYREQPALVKQTLDAVAALDYPNFEAIVVVNNTPEEFYWKPIEEHCRALGARFKFVNVLGLKGFKAGALNLALGQTAPEAAVVAIIDADYVVHPDWFKHLVPAFADPAVALVQAPQDHRDGDRSRLKAIMNSEYAGFFDIGMIQRNEDDAIVLHGTMCLVRRSALVAVGGWSSDTIVEDTELGLRLYEAGYHALYTNRRYGHGVLPDTFQAYKTQRERWAYGAIQIIRKHWHHMLPGARTLRPEQKREFVAGWAFWLSDALGAAASILNLLWVPAILFVGVLIPTVALTLPIVTAFAVNLAHCALLYRARVKVPLAKIAGAALAAMSLQITVAGAVMNGLVRDNLPFKRTDKGGNAKRRANDHPVKRESVLGFALLAAAAALVLTNEFRVTEIDVFAFALLIQSLPFLAATLMAAIEAWDARERPAPEPTLPALPTAPSPTPTAVAPQPIYPLAAE